MKMKCCVLLVLLLQWMGASGLPLFELSSKADEALRKALDEVNTRNTQHHLYKVTKASVTRILPLGMNMYDMLLKFGIRETDCQKDSRVDPQGCGYRQGFLVSEADCYIRVRLADRFTNILSLKCILAQSSSSEPRLSEEMVTRWNYDINHLSPRDPVPSTATPFVDVIPPIRGGGANHFDTHGDFSNHLE